MQVHTKYRKKASIRSHPKKANSLSTEASSHVLPSVVSDFSHKPIRSCLQSRSENAYFEMTNAGINSDTHIFGVCEGSGEEGRKVSKFVRDHLPHYLSNSPFLLCDVKKALYSSILQTSGLLREQEIDSVLSGCTLLVIVIQGTLLYSANLGDCRGVLARKQDQNWLAISLANEHSPEVPEESARIQAAGGQVESLCNAQGNFVGPPRIWAPEQDVPGITVTRAIGHQLAASIGLIDVPEILKFQLTSRDSFVVLGTSSLFQYVSLEDTVRLAAPARKFGDPGDANYALQAEARNRSSISEDFTSICIFLNLNFS